MMIRIKLMTRWRENKRGESAVRKSWELISMNAMPAKEIRFHIAKRWYGVLCPIASARRSRPG
jgi:hypothetical protein